MSFLGTNQNFNANAQSSSIAILDSLNLYYDENTTFHTTEEYDLYTVGTICTDLNTNQIEKTLENAEGTFSYVLFLKKEKKTIVGTDKMGFYPLYYTDDMNNFLFGNFIPHIKHRLKNPEPNWESWDELLNTGDILGRKSTIKGIYRLRQGEKIYFTEKTYSLKSFWRYEGVSFVDPEKYINLNNDLLSESMQILSNNTMKKIFPLTGGHDSRRIAITANSLGIDIEAITQEDPSKDLLDKDTLVASLVAEKLGINNHILLSQPDRISLCANMVYKDYWCGFESHHHVWAVNIAKNLKRNTIIFDGIIGGVTMNNHFFLKNPEYLDFLGDIDRVVSIAAPTPKKFQLKDHLTSSTLQDRVRAELNEYPQDCNQVTLFKVFNHTRRNIGQWQVSFLMKGINFGLPYAYSPFFLQSLSLDKKYRLDKHYQQECMLRTNSEVARIPSTRESLSSRYWQDFGATKVNDHPSYPSKLTASSRVFSFIKTGKKSQILDGIFLNIAPKFLKTKRSWYYEPLNRLNLFLEWLETDESHLPVLFKGIPAFVEDTLRKHK